VWYECMLMGYFLKVLTSLTEDIYLQRICDVSSHILHLYRHTSLDVTSETITQAPTADLPPRRPRCTHSALHTTTIKRSYYTRKRPAAQLRTFTFALVLVKVNLAVFTCTAQRPTPTRFFSSIITQWGKEYSSNAK
jgi:hypothetical protein